MIKVDCTEVLPIKHELMIFVADKVAAIPAGRKKGFVLSPFDEENKIDLENVISVVKQYLYSIGKLNSFSVFSEVDVVKIKSKDGRKIDRKTSSVNEVKTSYYTWESPFGN